MARTTSTVPLSDGALFAQHAAVCLKLSNGIARPRDLADLIRYSTSRLGDSTAVDSGDVHAAEWKSPEFDESVQTATLKSAPEVLAYLVEPGKELLDGLSDTITKALHGAGNESHVRVRAVQNQPVFGKLKRVVRLYLEHSEVIGRCVGGLVPLEKAYLGYRAGHAGAGISVLTDEEVATDTKWSMISLQWTADSDEPVVGTHYAANGLPIADFDAETGVLAPVPGGEFYAVATGWAGKETLPPHVQSGLAKRMVGVLTPVEGKVFALQA